MHRLPRHDKRVCRVDTPKRVGKEQLDYRYIIVDEYQDISRQRYNLIKELSQLCNAKSWQ